MNKDSRWYLRPLQPILRDWTDSMHTRNVAADKHAHLALWLLTSEPVNRRDYKPEARAADLEPAWAFFKTLTPKHPERAAFPDWS